MKQKIKIFVIFSWLLLSLSMTGWWVIFVFQLIEKLPDDTDMTRFKNMIFWEGSIGMILILCAGTALAFYVIREKKQAQRFRAFVASFTHDLKTSLTSLRLQVESLKEDIEEDSNPFVSRLIADTARLQLQLENSLLLAHESSQKLYYEPLRLSHLLQSLEHSWPQVKIHLLEDMDIYGDERAINSILRNIIHNSVIHGRANKIFIEASCPSSKNSFPIQDDSPHLTNLINDDQGLSSTHLQRSSSREKRDEKSNREKLLKQKARAQRISIKDNGEGFHGDSTQLAQLFYRHNPSSGSGVGLYIVSQLMSDMKGRVSFPKRDRGFQVDLEWT